LVKFGLNVIAILLFCALLFCSWSQSWGMNGSVKIAYGAAYVMQPDYTFALQFHNASTDSRVRMVRQRLKPALALDSTKPDCVLFTPKQAHRLVKLADDLTTLTLVAPGSTMRLSKANILADIVASNVKYLPSLKLFSAASRGPFRVCGASAMLLRVAVCQGSC
jgi:hypothetical protein